MTGWTAIVPIKPQLERKTRLAADIDHEARISLTELMLHRVLDVLAEARPVCEILLLSAAPLADRRVGWIEDRGRGLNAELAAAARDIERLLVVHADLPSLCTDDVTALADAACRGVAIAPDRARTGTNALGFRRANAIPFCFGAGSFSQHLRLAANRALPVNRPGLALDIDVPGDIAAAVERGALPLAYTAGKPAAWIGELVSR